MGLQSLWVFTVIMITFYLFIYSFLFMLGLPINAQSLFSLGTQLASKPHIIQYIKTLHTYIQFKKNRLSTHKYYQERARGPK